MVLPFEFSTLPRLNTVQPAVFSPPFPSWPLYFFRMLVPLRDKTLFAKDPRAAPFLSSASHPSWRWEKLFAVYPRPSPVPHRRRAHASFFADARRSASLPPPLGADLHRIPPSSPLPFWQRPLPRKTAPSSPSAPRSADGLPGRGAFARRSFPEERCL